MRFIKKLRKAWFKGSFREIIKRAVKKIFLGPGITFFEKFGFHILPVHYYSPVPAMRKLRENPDLWYKEGSFAGIDFNIKEQLNLLNDLRIHRHEYDKLIPYENIENDCFGEGYGEVESHILHAMVRRLKPRTIIEVGSGVSTFFSAQALSLNKLDNPADSKIICIEPYPWPKLNKIADDGTLEIIKKPVQAVEASFFKKLQKNDILFIDSSHIVKMGSDVNYLYLEVLPNLNKGIIIHIHDIFFPYPSFNPDMRMFGEHRFWTEQALVHAFLINNLAYKILFCSSYLHHKYPEKLKSTFNIYDFKRHLPSSLWLEKVG